MQNPIWPPLTAFEQGTIAQEVNATGTRAIHAFCIFEGGESIYDVYFAFWEHLGCKITKSNMAATETGTKAMEVNVTLSCEINTYILHTF